MQDLPTIFREASSFGLVALCVWPGSTQTHKRHSEWKDQKKEVATADAEQQKYGNVFCWLKNFSVTDFVLFKRFKPETSADIVRENGVFGLLFRVFCQFPSVMFFSSPRRRRCRRCRLFLVSALHLSRRCCTVVVTLFFVVNACIKDSILSWMN